MTPHQLDLQVRGYNRRHENLWQLFAAHAVNNVNHTVNNILQGFNGKRYKPLDFKDLTQQKREKRSMSEFDNVQEIYEWLEEKQGRVV